MHTQRDLYSPMCGTTRAKQGGLYDGQAVESDLACGQCGRPLIETVSGYLCCPNGHGKLLEESYARWRAAARVDDQGDECPEPWE